MTTRTRALLVGLLSLLATALMASVASAAGGINLIGGSFAAVSAGLQTIATTLGGLIPTTIACTQTLTLRLTGGLLGGSGLRTAGTITGAAFTCNPTALGTPRITVLTLPWTIGLDPSRDVSQPGGGSAALATVLGVSVNVTLGPASCLFRGNLSYGMTNNSATLTLLGGTLTPVSGGCTNAVVGRAALTLSPRPTFTVLPSIVNVSPELVVSTGILTLNGSRCPVDVYKDYDTSGVPIVPAGLTKIGKLAAGAFWSGTIDCTDGETWEWLNLPTELNGDPPPGPTATSYDISFLPALPGGGIAVVILNVQIKAQNASAQCLWRGNLLATMGTTPSTRVTFAASDNVLALEHTSDPTCEDTLRMSGTLTNSGTSITLQ